MANTKTTNLRKPTPDPKLMILDQDKWPMWPNLPLKRRDSSPTVGFIMATVGFIMATEEYPKVLEVYLCNVFEAADIDITKVDTIKYTSVDDLLAAGWEVD